MPTGTPTPNTGLNQWQLDDELQMNDFNADNQKVDSAIAALNTQLASKASLTELAAKADLADLENLASQISTEALEALTERVEALEQNGVPGGGTGPDAPLPSQSRISVAPGNGSAEVSIENLGGAAYAGTKLVWKQGTSMPESQTDGTVLDAGMYPERTVTGLTNDQAYTMRAFAYNLFGQAQNSVEGAIASFIPLEEYPLFGLPIGSAVNIGVDGEQREFIVVHQGRPSTLYDSSFNGGTILLMKDLYESRPWHSSNVNDYANSTIHSYLNGAFLDLIDENIRAEIKQVKIPYRPGSGTSQTVRGGSIGLAAKVWLLSGCEVNWTTATNQYLVADGATLSYFAGTAATDAKRIGYLNGVATSWWLRSPYTSSSAYAWYVLTKGSLHNHSTSPSYGCRPALVLPDTIPVRKIENSDGTYSLMP